MNDVDVVLLVSFTVMGAVCLAQMARVRRKARERQAEEERRRLHRRFPTMMRLQAEEHREALRQLEG